MYCYRDVKDQVSVRLFHLGPKEIMEIIRVIWKDICESRRWGGNRDYIKVNVSLSNGVFKTGGWRWNGSLSPTLADHGNYQPLNWPENFTHLLRNRYHLLFNRNYRFHTTDGIDTTPHLKMTPIMSHDPSPLRWPRQTSRALPTNPQR